MNLHLADNHPQNNSSTALALLEQNPGDDCSKFQNDKDFVCLEQLILYHIAGQSPEAKAARGA